MRGTDRAQCLINLLPSEDVCVSLNPRQMMTTGENEGGRGEREEEEKGGAVMQGERGC